MAQTKVNTTKQINMALRSRVGKSKVVRIGGLKGHDSIAVGLAADIHITVDGDAGDFFGALNKGATLVLHGKAGRYLGDSMLSGKIITESEVGKELGHSMHGGVIVVKGDGGNKVGAFMKGGTILIAGNVGDDLGMGMEGGTIIVTGDIGKNAGFGMKGGNIFVGGEMDAVGKHAAILESTPDDKKVLADLFQQYAIKTKILVFEKIGREGTL